MINKSITIHNRAKMIENLSKTIVKHGQTKKWFFDKYIKDEIGLSYSGFMSQVNGYSPLTEPVKKQIELYLSDYADRN